MKQIKSLGILITVMASLSSCMKDNTEHVFYFYTSADISKNELNLYVDGNYKGMLKNISSVPDCSSPDSILNSMIIEQFRYGKYKIVAKDENENIVIDGIIKFKRNSMSSSGSGNNGGISINGSDNCVIVDVFI